MTKPDMPTKADRAYALHLMGVDSEGIGRRLGETPTRSAKLARDGKRNVERRAAAMMEAAE